MTAVTVMPHEHDVPPHDHQWLPHDHDWTVADLERLPDDGLRYELFDGILTVSPAPTPRHQDAVLQLAVLLDRLCPRELKVFVAPLDFQPTEQRSFEPDVVAARRDRIGEKNITHPPVLVVEILSYRLDGGAYREVARATGAQEVTLDAPFTVTLRPDRLTDL